MWKQLLFWAAAGPKHFQRFVLFWLVLMALFFFAFVHEAFDGSSQAAPLPRPPASTRR